MFKGLILSIFATLGLLTNGYNPLVNCKLPGGVVRQIRLKKCLKLGGAVVTPSPIPLITPTPTLVPTSTPTAIPTAPIERPVPTNTPAPTPEPRPRIDSVLLEMCTPGSSCYGYVLGVDVRGSGFAADTRVRLHHVTLNGQDYFGSYQGGDGTTRILTDFYNLPRCEHFDVIAYGSTGTATAQNTIVSYCP